jgi:hypothetical protein
VIWLLNTVVGVRGFEPPATLKIRVLDIIARFAPFDRFARFGRFARFDRFARLARST